MISVISKSPVLPTTAVAFIGLPHILPMAYPDDLREEIAGCARICGHDVSSEDWQRSLPVLRQAEILMGCWGMPEMTAEFLDACPRLRAVFYAGGAAKSFYTHDASERGIILSTAVSANSIPVAEYSLGVILLSLRSFWRYVMVEPSEKGVALHERFSGAYGSTVGLVSLGTVGRLVAKHLRNHDVKVVAYDPIIEEDEAANLGVRLVSLEELFRESDVVSVHAPLLPETTGLINEDLLVSMKHSATLINTARGAVIDEDALCRVLENQRRDLFAVLDVTCQEPPAADSPLRYLPNVVLTPHIAGSGMAEIARMGWLMHDELKRHLGGQPLKHSIDISQMAVLA